MGVGGCAAAVVAGRRGREDPGALAVGSNIRTTRRVAPASQPGGAEMTLQKNFSALSRGGSKMVASSEVVINGKVYPTDKFGRPILGDKPCCNPDLLRKSAAPDPDSQAAELFGACDGDHSSK